MPELLKTQETIWKRLTRLFRSGPVVRHKIAAGEKLIEPRGTARAYKKEISSLYVHALSSYGQYERLSRYADYSEMEFTPEIASALDIYADETTTKDENGVVIRIHSKNPEIKQSLETLFDDIIDIDFNIWSWVRSLCKYGDFILIVDASETNGILHLMPIPINEIEREEGYDKEDPHAVRFRWLTQGNAILENWQIIHFRMLGNDNFLPYGQSIIEPARRIWRQLILIEDAMLIYRIVRSPERRVFNVEVGSIPPDQVEQFMQQIQTKLRRNQVIDPTTGRVDLRYNPLSVDEDYFLPVRDGQGTKIDTLAGGQFTGDIDDVQYIQNKLFAALKVPKAYLGYEAELGSKATLSQQDVRFARTIERVQKIVIAELNKIAMIHLALLGYEGPDLVDFQITMGSPSTVAEQQKLELWRQKLEIAGSAAAEGPILSKSAIWHKIFGMSDSDVERMKDEMKEDKLQQLELDAMQLPPEAGGAPGGGPPTEEPPPEGAEDLPDTLGGEPGGPPEGPGTPPPAPEGFTLADMVPNLTEDGDDIEEGGPGSGNRRQRPNDGSAGNDTIVAVDRGKDLFDPGYDQYELVFGRKKQTASDPYDSRAQRRLVTKPFSEEIQRRLDQVDRKMKESVERTKNIEEDMGRVLRQISRFR